MKCIPPDKATLKHGFSDTMSLYVQQLNVRNTTENSRW